MHRKLTQIQFRQLIQRLIVPKKTKIFDLLNSETPNDDKKEEEEEEALDKQALTNEKKEEEEAAQNVLDDILLRISEIRNRYSVAKNSDRRRIVGRTVACIGEEKTIV